jgi:hypothetical protein
MRLLLITAALLTLNVTQVSAKGLTDYIPNFLRTAEGVFLSNCEELLKERLRSPSSYSRLSHTFRSRRASPIEATGLDFKMHQTSLEEFMRFKDDFDGYVNHVGERTGSNLLKRIFKIHVEQYGVCLSGDCPNRAEAFIKYEAKNAFGTPLADTFVCEVNYTDDLKSESTSGYRINGWTNTAYFLSKLN